MKIEQIAAEIMDVSNYQYFSVKIMDIVHLIDDKSVNFTLVSTSSLTHDMNKM